VRPAIPDSPDWGSAVAAARARAYGDAHLVLARHYAGRTSCFPIAAANVGSSAAAVRRDSPLAVADARIRAESILQGKYDLLGYRALDFGSMPDWHFDPVHQRRSPQVFWTRVPYLEPSSGDHKIIWELNRHQHWLGLGRAYALTGDRRYYRAFTHQLSNWLATNPPLVGTNWSSMLELGLRSINWIAALEFFAGAAGPDDDEPWTVDLLIAIDRQLTHVEQNLSRYFSPNTHLSGEALALYVAGMVLPELKASGHRAALGRDVLVEEATRQVRGDGGHAELSAHYHRYSTDFYLLALSVARKAGDTAAAVFEEAVRKQARYLRTISDDAGLRPQIGDDDGGQLFAFCGGDCADCRSSLAHAAMLLNEPALSIGRPPEETYWLCGADTSRASGETVSPWTSAALWASGYFVSRTRRGDHLTFDAGPHGFLNGGHAHADALSCVLSVAGRPLLVDGGTATYTMDADVRNRFRGTSMHNTVVVDGRMQADPDGPFHWKTMTSAHASVWRSGTDCDYMEGTHDAYAPLRHSRAILAIHGLGWWILDHLLGTGRVVAESYWHFHPSWACALSDPGVVRLERADAGPLALVTTAHLQLWPPGTHPLATFSPIYGQLQPAPTACARVPVELPVTLATFIPAAPEVAAQLDIEATPVEQAPGPGWHAGAFRIRWAHGAAAIMAAVERADPPARDTAAPGVTWGTADLRSDARVAAVVDHATNPSEVILVNGTVMETSAGDRLVALARPAPLLRTVLEPVAATVHEVGMV
jgi:hypothetical protein